MTNPLKPNPQLLIELGSLIVHAEEALDPKLGSYVDLQVFKSSLAKPDVQEWISEMRKMALLPEKRKITRGRI